jgi:hypothetical protein
MVVSSSLTLVCEKSEFGCLVWYIQICFVTKIVNYKNFESLLRLLFHYSGEEDMK